MCYSLCMAGLDLQQKQIQSQLQIMSQKQIQSLELLSLGSEDLQEAVTKASLENPALIVRRGPRDFTRTSSTVSRAASEASDNFEAALESRADSRETLKEHLLLQLHTSRLSRKEEELGEKLIHNLDSHGFHVLAPASLAEGEQAQSLGKMLDLIQSFDPPGTCTANIQESLYAQARQRKSCTPLTLFLLDGHLNFLDPPVPKKVIAKIKAWQKEQSRMFAQDEKTSGYIKLSATAEQVEESLRFIRGLDPYPAREYGTQETHFVSPDIYVERAKENSDADKMESGIVTAGGITWKIRLSRETVPELRINKSVSSAESAELKANVKKAQDLIDAVQFRQSTLLKAACIIVKRQSDFFKNGPGNLRPLRQADIADDLQIHETTVSRMANGKYMQCEWGLFEIKYFFTNALSSAEGGADISRDKALHELASILAEHSGSQKKLSDQKLSALLEERGIKVARRTVAKYRAMLNVESSYNR